MLPLIRCHKQSGFTMLEMLLTLAVLCVIFTTMVVAAHQLFDLPAERSALTMAKNNLAQAVNIYYLNNYKKLRHKSWEVPLGTLVDEGYIDKNSLYQSGRFEYSVAIEAVGSAARRDRLLVMIKTKDVTRLSWMRPDEVRGDQAIWYVAPHYNGLTNSLKYNAVKMAQEIDPDDKM